MTRRHAWGAAVLVAAFVFSRVYAHETLAGGSGGDFAVYRGAALTVLGGGNPYGNGLLYPLPAVLLVIPLVWMSPVAGAATFAALGMGVLTYGALRVQGWAGAMILLSPACFLGWYYLQWSPYVVASAFLPWMGAFGAAKPNLALAPWVYRPDWRPLAGGAVLVLLSFLVLPSWPVDWFHDLSRATAPHRVVPWQMVGVLVLIWSRGPHARALAAMSLSPLNPQFYDHLGVWLAVKGWRESLALSVTGWLALLVFLATAPHDLTTDATPAYLALAFGVYLPALALTLWRFRTRAPSPR